MAAFVVASATRRHFIFEPTRAAFDSGHEMFGRRTNETLVEYPATPDTRWTIAFDDHDHPFPTVGLTACVRHLTRMVLWRAVSHLLRPVTCISATCERR